MDSISSETAPTGFSTHNQGSSDDAITAADGQTGQLCSRKILTAIDLTPTCGDKLTHCRDETCILTTNNGFDQFVAAVTVYGSAAGDSDTVTANGVTFQSYKGPTSGVQYNVPHTYVFGNSQIMMSVPQRHPDHGQNLLWPDAVKHRTGTPGWSPATTAFEKLVADQACYYVGTGSPPTIIFNGLTVGQEYQAQIFAGYYGGHYKTGGLCPSNWINNGKYPEDTGSQVYTFIATASSHSVELPNGGGSYVMLPSAITLFSK